MNNLKYLKSLFSPFKPFKLKWYCGKIAIGVPYFYPRKWVKSKDKPGYLTAIPKKIGFDLVGLGWKTKYDEYRFEYSPLISFVFFKWQIAIMVIAPYLDHYWESWLYYEYRTDKNKSKQERINQCRIEAPQIWIREWEKDEIRIDYYDLILKEKYLKIK